MRRIGEREVALERENATLRAALKAIDEDGCDRDCYYYPDAEPCAHKRARDALAKLEAQRK